LGLTTGKLPAEFIPKWATYLGALSSTSSYALGVGSATLAMLVLHRRFAPQLPAFLIALLVASLAVALLHLPVATVGDCFPAMLLEKLWPRFIGAERAASFQAALHQVSTT
jgi:sulfate permease, SulP family